jgi:hypothetical protein
MIKNLFTVGLYALSMSLPTSLALAQDEGSPTAQETGKPQQGKQSEAKKNTLKARADLHERISKAHKNAASCLKDGKRSESDCATQLSKECQATGASKDCMVKSGEGMAGQMSTDQPPSS